MNYLRHGDLSFAPLKEAPKNLIKVEHGNNFILARGEHTNHKHVLATKERVGFEIFRDEAGSYILNIKEASQITHEEHKPLTIVPGWYKLGHEQEHDYALNETRRVID